MKLTLLVVLCLPAALLVDAKQAQGSNIYVSEEPLPCDRWDQCSATDQVAVFKHNFVNAQSMREPFESNGCGTAGFRMHVPPELELCCDLHDACYSVCNITRSHCDNDFRRCLKRQCGEVLQSVEGCGNTAATMSMAADSFGCSAFQSAQAAACRCVAAGPAARSEIERAWQALYAGPLMRIKSPDQVSQLAAAALANKDPAARYNAVVGKYHTALIKRTQSKLGESEL